MNNPIVNFFLYPAGSGGKFLINCVSLNDYAVFQDHLLAQRQLNGDFGINEKTRYIFDNLKIAQGTLKWTDLELGDFQLYGVPNEQYLCTFPEIIKKRFENNSLIQKCIQNSVHLNMAMHDWILFEAKLRVWPMARSVIFTNYRSFLQKRKHGKIKDSYLDTYWNKVRDVNWPKQAPLTAQELSQLPKYIQTDLRTIFNNEIERYLDYGQDFDILWDQYTESFPVKFVFDVEYAYKNCYTFYEVYTEVCDYLSVPPANEPIIIKYFSQWQKTINLLSEQE
jgi:hypothetical protein